MVTTKDLIRALEDPGSFGFPTGKGGAIIPVLPGETGSGGGGSSGGFRSGSAGDAGTPEPIRPSGGGGGGFEEPTIVPSGADVIQLAAEPRQSFIQQQQQQFRTSFQNGIPQPFGAVITTAGGFGDVIKDISGPTREEIIQSQLQGRFEEQFQSMSPEQLRQSAFTPGSGITGMSTLEGEQFTFTPTEEQIKTQRKEIGGEIGFWTGRGAEARVGLAKFGVGLIDFGVAIPTQFATGGLIDPDKEPVGFIEGGEQVVSKIPFIGEQFEQIRETPIGFTGKSVELGASGILLLGGGASLVSQARGGGVLKTTIRVGEELAGGLSPIKLKGGIFSPDVTKFKTVSFKEQLGDDVLARTGFGTSREGVSKIQFDIFKELPSGKITGGQGTLIESPAISIGAGGGRVDVGRLITAETSKFFTTGVGKGRIVTGKGDFSIDVGDPLGAGAGLTFGRPTKAFFIGEETLTGFKFSPRQFQLKRFGGLAEGEGFVKRFAGGRVSRIERFLGRPRKLRTDIQEFGLEFDLTKLTSDSVFGFGKVGKKKPKGFLDFGLPSLQEQQISKQLGGFVPPTTTTTPKITTQTTEVLAGPGAFGVLRQKPSQFVGTGIYETTLTQKDLVSPLSLTSLASPITTKGRERSLISPSLASRTSLGVGQILGVTPIQQPKTKQLTRQKQILDLDIPLKPRGRAGFDFGFAPRGFRGFGFPILPPPIGIPEFGIRRPKGKRRFRRTPSLISLELGIFAKKPLREELSGLTARPILTSGKKRKRRNIFDNLPQLI